MRIILSAAVAVDRRGRRRARGGGSCGLALLEPRILNHAEVRAQKVFHCREHRRLLDRGAEQGHSLCRKDRRFIGSSSPSSLTSTGSRSRADWR